MKMLKNNYGLCSEGSMWELTREMAYELWIFFFQWNLFYHNSLRNVILCILKRMRINLISHPLLFIDLFIFVQKKTLFSCTTNSMQLSYDQSKDVTE